MPPAAIIETQIRGPGLVGPRQVASIVHGQTSGTGELVAEFERTRAAGLLMADTGDDIAELADRWASQSDAAWYVAKQTTAEALRDKLRQLGAGERLAILVAPDVGIVSDLVDRWSNA